MRYRKRAGVQPKSSLSVVCGTHYPGPMVAENLKAIRSLADQVVVGADERVSAEDISWYGSVADVLATFPFTGSNQFRAWLRNLATCDWILFVDGDEFPSAELLKQIPELMADKNVGAYALTTNWVFPTADTWIAEAPWHPHWQVRLVRNDDRLWFPSTKHTGPFFAGSTRRVDAPLVHLDLIHKTHEERVGKVERYDEESIGVLFNGRPINEAFYLPENSPELCLEPLAQADALAAARSLRAAFAEQRPPKRRPGLAVIQGSVEDIEKTLPWSALHPDDAKAEIRIIEVPSSVPAGTHFLVRLDVKNAGDRLWPSAEHLKPTIRLTYQWRSGDQVVVQDGLRTVLTHPLPPGQSTDIDVLVHAPIDPGIFTLVPDVVAEGERWFGSTESREVVVEESLADTAHTLSAEGRLALADLWHLRRKLQLQDSLQWYLSPTSVRLLQTTRGQALTPHQMVSPYGAGADVLARFAKEQNGPVVYLGDAEGLKELIEVVASAESGVGPILVVSTDSVNEQSLLAVIKTHDSSTSEVFARDRLDSSELASTTSFVLGFDQRPASIEKLLELQLEARKHHSSSQVLVLRALADASLSIMTELEKRGLVEPFDLSLDIPRFALSRVRTA